LGELLGNKWVVHRDWLVATRTKGARSEPTAPLVAVLPSLDPEVTTRATFALISGVELRDDRFDWNRVLTWPAASAARGPAEPLAAERLETHTAHRAGDRRAVVAYGVPRGCLELAPVDEHSAVELRPGTDQGAEVRGVHFTALQRVLADSISLTAMASPAVRDPGPLVTLVRNRTGANGDSIGGLQVDPVFCWEIEERKQLVRLYLDIGLDEHPVARIQPDQLNHGAGPAVKGPTRRLIQIGRGSYEADELRSTLLEHCEVCSPG
jgi:hypothetical protein